MNHKFLFFLLFTNYISFCQDMSQSLVSTNGGSNSTGLIDLKAYEKNTKIEGSPYVVDRFLPATVEGVNGTYLMRYNAASDDIEYQKEENNIFVLNKSLKKYDVTFMANKYKYSVYNYIDAKGESVKGFLIELFSSTLTLLKRERINYVPQNYPKNGYEDLVPAHYERVDDEFYLKEGDKISPFPKNKKQLFLLYPQYKDNIDSFLKSNKISFKKESDLIALVSFLSNLKS
jgi:hypothetical protein